MIKNKSVLGLSNFVEQYYNDCKAGIVGDWWNERYGKKGERIKLTLNGDSIKNPFELINYIKENYKEISKEDIEEAKSIISRTYMVLNYKRVYLWEVKQEDSKAEPSKIDFSKKVEEDKEVEEKEELNEDQEESQESENSPDFDYAKTIEDKQELKDYAKSFGFNIDSRKSLQKMMGSFQGKYHASKSK